MKKDKLSLGNRMKSYEHVTRHVLTRRTPVILRVDGRAFHTYTRHFKRPFDEELHHAMAMTAEALLCEIQGSKIAYGQSDEISILITDYDKLESEAWFGNNIQKMVSISASVATIAFNNAIGDYMQPPGYAGRKPMAQFDSRVFNIPREEVNNYFIWRQQDASRNSVQMLARAHFSHKECQNKNVSDLQEMLFHEKEINWNNVAAHFRRGFCISKHEGAAIWDRDIPLFTKDRNYIERFVS